MRRSNYYIAAGAMAGGVLDVTLRAVDVLYSEPVREACNKGDYLVGLVCVATGATIGGLLGKINGEVGK
jgi:hypothetical protein